MIGCGLLQLISDLYIYIYIYSFEACDPGISNMLSLLRFYERFCDFCESMLLPIKSRNETNNIFEIPRSAALRRFITRPYILKV